MAMADVCDTSDFQPILVCLSRDENSDETHLSDRLQKFRCTLEFKLLALCLGLFKFDFVYSFQIFTFLSI